MVQPAVGHCSKCWLLLATQYVACGAAAWTWTADHQKFCIISAFNGPTAHGEPVVEVSQHSTETLSTETLSRFVDGLHCGSSLTSLDMQLS